MGLCRERATRGAVNCAVSGASLLITQSMSGTGVARSRNERAWGAALRMLETLDTGASNVSRLHRRPSETRDERAQRWAAPAELHHIQR